MSKQATITRNGHEFVITIIGTYSDGSADISVECATEGIDWYREFSEVNDPSDIGWDADFEPWTDAIDACFGE